MDWKEEVREALRLRLEAMVPPLLEAYRGHEKISDKLGCYNLDSFLLEEGASLDLRPYLAPPSRSHFTPLLGGLGEERIIPLRLGFYHLNPEVPFWLQVKGERGKKPRLLYGREDGFGPERAASILAEATGFHPRKVAGLLKALDAFQTQVEKEISLRTRELLRNGKAFLKELNEALGVLGEKAEELLAYLRDYSLHPEPSPLLREAFTLSLRDLLAKEWLPSWARTVAIRLLPGGVEYVRERGEKKKRVEVERASDPRDRARFFGYSLDVLMYRPFLERIGGFTARVEGILAEAKALSQGQNLGEVLRRTSKRLEEVVQELEALVQAYPFVRGLLPQEPLVLELGVDSDPPWTVEIRALAVDFQGEDLLVHRDHTGCWYLGGETEVLGLLYLPEEEARKAVASLVEFTAILAQAYREAHKGAEALLEEEEAQYIRDLYLAGRVKDL